jgi:glutathione synthase/RimK-type ligase-like ATP-grasp enzyme
VTAILLVGPADDAHVAAVAARLARLGAEAAVLELAAFPARSAIALAFGPGSPGAYLVRDGGRGLDLGAFDVVWWRKPARLEVDPALDGRARQLAVQDASAALAGLWHSLEPRWVNDPVRQDVAARKPFQLAVAARAGWCLPRTVVTNDRDAARAFLATCRRRQGRPDAVVKALTVLGDEPSPTRRVDPGSLERLPLAPVILQEYVDGVDVRATVVGRAIFAMEVDARGSACAEDCRVDWDNVVRTARRVELPSGVAARLRATMDRLGLAYGAFDLRRTDEGEHVFLEVNPTGEWLYVEELSGLPVTNAVADLLAEPSR